MSGSAMLCPLCGDRSTDREVCEHDGQTLIDDLSGGEVGGRYALIGLAGIGAQGSTVWEADSPDGPVAVKLIEVKPDQPLEPVLDRIVSQLSIDCPACVRAIDSGIWRGRIYVVTPLLDLDALSDHLTSEPQPDKAVRFGRAILEALVPLHASGRAHGNLHPANVFIDDETQPVAVSLLDAGQSAACFASRPPGDPLMLEPTRVFAPEQLAADEVAPPTDVYQVGALMYRLATGRAPFETTDVEHLIRLKMTAQPETLPCLDETPHLRDLLSRALSPRKAQRHADASAMLAALTMPVPDLTAAVLAAVPSPDSIPAQSQPQTPAFVLTDAPAPVFATAPVSTPAAAEPLPLPMALDEPASAPKSRRGLVLLLLLLVGAGAAWLLRDQFMGASPDPSTAPPRAASTGQDPAPKSTASAASAESVTPRKTAPPSVAVASGASAAEARPAPVADPIVDPVAPASTPLVQVAIKSVPSGAAVTVDGKFAGNTPWESALAQGKYAVVLSLPRYAKKALALQVDDDPVSIETRLIRKSRRWRARRSVARSTPTKPSKTPSALAAAANRGGVQLLDATARPKTSVPLLTAPPRSSVKLLGPAAPSTAGRRSTVKLLGQ